MNVFSKSLIAVFLTYPFSTMAETNCEERVAERKPPMLPRTTMNFASVVKQNGECFVDVEFELDKNGNSKVRNSAPSSKGCDVFVDSAREAVEKSKFTSGAKEICNMKIGFEFKP